MSLPASFRMGPGTTNTLVSKRYLILHLLIIWICSILPAYMMIRHFAVWDFKNFPDWSVAKQVEFFTLLPFYMFLWYGAWVIGAIFTAAIFLQIIKLMHKPREGFFPRDYKDKDFRYWSLRATVKKFAIWLSHNFWVPWLDLLAYKLFGVKVQGKVALFDAWVDTEFIKLGKNCTVGQGSVIMGAMLTRDWLIIKTTVLEDNTVVGGYSIVSPGTIIREGTVLGGGSATMVGQELESGWVYMGLPAKKFKENKAKYNIGMDFVKVKADETAEKPEE